MTCINALQSIVILLLLVNMHIAPLLIKNDRLDILLLNKLALTRHYRVIHLASACSLSQKAVLTMNVRMAQGLGSTFEVLPVVA